MDKPLAVWNRRLYHESGVQRSRHTFENHNTHRYNLRSELLHLRYIATNSTETRKRQSIHN